ncbi:CdaR family protein [Alkalicoccus halolimnae]|uniref:CdaR family protein n=1 Tax=Alkalicoccus halolimnae TaxID=1667239 RepID=A0A5C7F6Q5_9BACI|nr:CdaR family protein [Alkalicoccus halolimnae]TXF85260.1 YbbR-like domain-containing protein [Alkalicoccus halolimnae]
MDKLFSKRWFIKLTSVVIAVMLFLMVNIENQRNQTGGGIPGITNGTRVLEDVPLNTYYDEENYIVTEAPETVQVTLRGPQNVLTLSQVTQGQQEVFIDLEGLEAGTHYERVQYRGYPDNLNISVTPITVRVTLEERQSMSFPVEVDFNNVEDLGSGLEAGTPQIDPESVEVSGGAGAADEVDRAVVNVDLTDRREDFTESANVVLYDEAGSELDITADPSVVDVTVPITSSGTEVPLRTEPPEQLNSGGSVSSVNFEPETVTVYGPAEALEDISFIDIDVDWAEISEDTVMEVDVPVPEGAERVEPQQADLEISVGEDEEAEGEESREFSGFPIEVEGMAEDFSVEFPTFSNGEIPLLMRGNPSTLEEVERSDVQASVDLSGLSSGTHSVPLEVSGPEGVTFPQDGINVTVVLSGGLPEEEMPPPEEEEEEAPEENNEEADPPDESGEQDESEDPEETEESEETGETGESDLPQEENPENDLQENNESVDSQENDPDDIEPSEENNAAENAGENEEEVNINNDSA